MKVKKIVLGILLVSVLLFALTACNFGNQEPEHVHTAGRVEKANEVSPTCQTTGSYEEVVYCAECYLEFSRTTITTEVVDCEFEDGKCIYCGEITESEGLAFTLSDNSTYYIVSGIGTCTNRHISIPANYNGLPVKEIGEKAFDGKSLKSVVIPDSVTSIGYEAFFGCHDLVFNEYDNAYYLGNENNPYHALIKAKSEDITSCTIHDDTVVIAECAFNCFDSLTSVTIGDSVTSIGEAAFQCCSSLENVVIPNSVTSIGDCAFLDCDSFTSITIPDSVTSMGGGVFGGCDNLVFNEYDNAYYLGNENNPYHALIEAKNEDITSCTIHDDTVVIAGGAFIFCESLTSVTIPDSVATIGEDAFEYCYSLTSVTIPDSVTSIGEGAFYGCSSLTSIAVDENNKAYKSIDGNLYTKDGTVLIKYAAGKSDTSFTVPNSVTSIGDCAFQYSDSLTSIVIFNRLDSIGDSAFSSCDLLTSVIIGNGATHIGMYAFYECASLASITIFGSVASIGDMAFWGCHSIESVNISDIATWCETEFDDGSLSNPLSWAKNLYINGELVTELVIPDGVTSIGDYAFYNCSSLTSVTVDEDNEAYKSIDGNLYTKDGTILVQYAIGKSDTSFTVPHGVTSIGYCAFYNCSSLTSITIPDSVTSIGERAFSGCSSLTNINYNGTMDQWKAISKGSHWNSNTGNYTVYCTDGNISK